MERSSVRAVRITTGTALTARSCRSTCKPSRSGRPKSSSTASYPRCRMRMSAPRRIRSQSNPRARSDSTSAPATPSSSSTTANRTRRSFLGEGPARARGRHPHTEAEFGLSGSRVLLCVHRGVGAVGVDGGVLRSLAHEPVGDQRNQDTGRDVPEIQRLVTGPSSSPARSSAVSFTFRIRSPWSSSKPATAARSAQRGAEETGTAQALPCSRSSTVIALFFSPKM